MDPLTSQRIEEQRSRGMAERLLYALEVMQDGFAIKRANLRRAYPAESEVQIEARLLRWMADG